jgi:hypothetical protein
VGTADGRFSLPDDSFLVVRNSREHPGGGSITLRPVEGDTCEVDCGGPFAVFRQGREYLVEWEYGDLTVSVPDTVGELKAETNGGDLTAGDLRTPLDLLTQGGDLRLEGVSRQATARTLGGNAWVTLLSLDPGTKSEVTTNHGDLFAGVGPEFSGVVKASTLAGEVDVEESLGRVFGAARLAMPRCLAVEIGREPRAAEITLRTLHGNVFVEAAG